MCGMLDLGCGLLYVEKFASRVLRDLLLLRDGISHDAPPPCLPVGFILQGRQVRPPHASQGHVQAGGSGGGKGFSPSRGSIHVKMRGGDGQQGNYFTLDSTQEDVVRIQGEPDSKFFDGRYFIWYYGKDDVYIDFYGRVVGADNNSGNLMFR